MTTIARPRAGEVPPPRVAAYASSQGSVDAFARDSIAVPLHFPGQPRRPGQAIRNPLVRVNRHITIRRNPVLLERPFLSRERLFESINIRLSRSKDSV